MDSAGALAALGTASNLIQLVDFASRAIKSIDEICALGSTENVHSLQEDNDRLVQVQQALKQRQKLGTESQNLEKAEESLDAFLDTCPVLTDKISAIIYDLTLDTSISRKRDKFRVAVQSIVKSKIISRLLVQVESFQRDFCVHILWLVNSKIDVQLEQQSSLAKSLDQYGEDIVEVITINQSSLQALIHAVRAENEVQHGKTRQHYDQVVAAILTTRDGAARTITPAIVESPSETAAVGVSPQSAQTTVTFGGIRLDGGLTSKVNFAVVSDDYDRVPQRVKDGLFFRQITDRSQNVEMAHQNTDEWLFSDAALHERQWDSLVDWLNEGSGFYWVSGKAGSGKSTLMKFVLEDPRTRTALQQWSRGHEVVLSSFFFWNLGSSLQRSQLGLLRSLLHNIVSTREYLIPILFPSLCRAAVLEESRPPNQREPLGEPTLLELKRAFVHLAEEAKSLRICLFIDGLDEYDGDHNMLSELLLAISASPNIKVVGSSRPIPAYVDAFSACAKLRLQDLTYKDIRRYVGDKLRGHANMSKLEQREPHAAKQLIDEITRKASGVFLWVVLVVRSQLNGLVSFDSVEDLRKRIDELPVELEDLYKNIMSSIQPGDKYQASQILQLVLRSLTVQRGYPMTALQFSFAEEQEVHDAIEAPINPLTQRHRDVRVEFAEARIRSRCCGLVEVRQLQLNGRRDEPCVDFLHRTVVEFLTLDTVWPQLVSLTADPALDVNKSLLSSCLYEAKAMPYQPELVLESDRQFVHLFHMFEYARLIEDATGHASTNFLNEAEEVLVQRWAAAYEFKKKHVDKVWRIARQNVWTLLQVSLPDRGWHDPDTRLNFAAHFDLVLYMADKTARDPDTDEDARLLLLAGLLRRFFGLVPCSDAALRKLPKAIVTLVSGSINLNAPSSYFWEGDDVEALWKQTSGSTSVKFVDMLRSCSAWEFVLMCIADTTSTEPRSTRYLDCHGSTDDMSVHQAVLVIIQAMVQADANPDAARPFKTERARTRKEPHIHWRSALKILQSSLQGVGADGSLTDVLALLEEKGAQAREWQDDKDGDEEEGQPTRSNTAPFGRPVQRLTGFKALSRILSDRI